MGRWPDFRRATVKGSPFRPAPAIGNTERHAASNYKVNDVCHFDQSINLGKTPFLHRCALPKNRTGSARDSDTHKIAGQDAVRALLQSNDLLAQAVRTLGAGRGNRRVTATRAPGSFMDPGAAFLDVLREHLVHAAAVLSDIELTRVRRASPTRTGRRRPYAKPGGARKDPRSMG